MPKGLAFRPLMAALAILVMMGLALVAVGVVPNPMHSRPPDFPPFVMTIEDWSAQRIGYSDGRTVAGTYTYRLDYRRRDEWTLLVVGDSLGVATGEGYGCRGGTYGMVTSGGSFRPMEERSGNCNGVHRWIHPGIACCYHWTKVVADGLITYTDPGERIVFDERTGLPVLYEAGSTSGEVRNRTVFRIDSWSD
jgi:hypothetical protein